MGPEGQDGIHVIVQRKTAVENAAPPKRRGSDRFELVLYKAGSRYVVDTRTDVSVNFARLYGNVSATASHGAPFPAILTQKDYSRSH